jgi:predicted DNA-binding protein (MmcQ/YjbR family)
MNVSQLNAFCSSLPAATATLYEEPYNFLVYAVGGKKFAYFKTSSPERWRFSTRVSPDRFLELTDVPGVKPARYRGRFLWITIVNVSGFPAPYLRELVEASYQRAFASLRRARRNSIRASDRAVNGDGIVRGIDRDASKRPSVFAPTLLRRR